jgi:hypothetical protein
MPISPSAGFLFHADLHYCAYQWISDYTYTRIRDRLNLEEALPAGPALVAGATPEVVMWPEASLAGPPDIRLAETQLPVPQGEEERFALMMAPAYASPPIPRTGAEAPEKPAPAAYAEPPAVTVGAAGSPAPEDRSAVGAAMPDATSLAELQPGLPTSVPARELRQADLLSVVGTANLTRKTGNIQYVRRVSQGLVPTSQPDRTVELRVLDGLGRELARIIHQAGRHEVRRGLSSRDRHRRPSPYGEGW